MTSPALRRLSGRLTAFAIAMVLFAIAYMPFVSQAHIDRVEDRFAFEPHEIVPVGELGGRSIRDVHPDYRHIASWISSVGASVAIGDIDNDGLANDLCLVDPRNDSVTIRPALEEEHRRYAAFGLTAASVPEGPPIAPTGCFFADVNADGRQDIVVYYWGRTPVVFRNDGDMGTNGFSAHEIAPGEIWYSNAGLFADIDGDGFGDLLIGNYFPDDSGVLDATGVRPVEMQHSMSRAANAGRNRLFLNIGAISGTLSFKDMSDRLDGKMANGWTLALGAADLTGDGLAEIYIANDFGPDRLLLNQSKIGSPTFVIAEGRRGLFDPRSTVLGRDSFKGMGVDFGDVDDDGNLDIYVSNIAEEYALNESHFLFMRDQNAGWDGGSVPYRNRSGSLGLARSSWSWDAKLADMDNDGQSEALQATGFVKGARDRWPELHELAMGNDELLKHPAAWPSFAPGGDLSGDRHDPFYVMGADSRFHDMAEVLGLGAPAVSRGIALADIDGDGDLDFAVARQWEPSLLYRNIGIAKGKSLLLDLRLSNANGTTRPLIGAVARLYRADGRITVGVSDTSNGHSGHRSPEIHFGLGANPDSSVAVDVTWRDASGMHQQSLGLTPGRHRIVLDRIETATIVEKIRGDAR